MKLSDLPVSIRAENSFPHTETATDAWNSPSGQAAMIRQIVCEEMAAVVLSLDFLLFN